MKTEAIMWGWLFNGTPSEEHLYKTPEDALVVMYYRPEHATVEQLAERGITLARVRVTVEVVAELKRSECE